MVERIHLLFADPKAIIHTYCERELDLSQEGFLPAAWMDYEFIAEGFPTVKNGDGWVQYLCSDCYRAWVESFR